MHHFDWSSGVSSRRARKKKKQTENNQRTYFGPFKNIFVNIRCQRPYEIKRNVNAYISFIMQPIRHLNF